MLVRYFNWYLNDVNQTIQNDKSIMSTRQFKLTVEWFQVGISKWLSNDGYQTVQNVIWNVKPQPDISKWLLNGTNQMLIVILTWRRISMRTTPITTASKTTSLSPVCSIAADTFPSWNKYLHLFVSGDSNFFCYSMVLEG